MHPDGPHQRLQLHSTEPEAWPHAHLLGCSHKINAWQELSNAAAAAAHSMGGTPPSAMPGSHD